jgi:hypothetical protein
MPNTHKSTEIEISFLPSASNSESGGSVAVVLKFVVTRRLLAWGVLRSATGGCLCFLDVSGAGLVPMSSGERKFS